MAIRFRKSFKIAPGVRWNVSGSGSSFTIGPRGASVGVGSRGTYFNAGIPGTGLSSRTKLFAGGSAQAPPQAVETTTVSMRCGVNDEGTLFFQDQNGNPVPDRWVELAKKQNKEALLTLIAQKCDDINKEIEALGRLHHGTPSPFQKLVVELVSPPEMGPIEPRPQPLGFLDKIFRHRRRRVEAANRVAQDAYRHAYSQWYRTAEDFERRMQTRRQLVETLIYSDVPAMEQWLQERLEAISWPRETLVAFEIRDAGALVMIDVDLPELEDMPRKLAAVPARGLKLSVKELSPTKVQQLYAEHIHGILFKLTGEAFAALPKSKTVVTSGYSQRRNRATGQLGDEYLLSVLVKRADWEAVSFTSLSDIDVLTALSRFDLRRDMLKSGQFRVIQPHSELSSVI